jgi:AcrR family transcriptional regulator
VPPVDACRARSRATALPPDERRQAIVDAVVPLLLEHGAGVSTRQIAQAAGVAEGTLFRVFDDKAALLHSAAHALLDPERTRAVLAAVDPGLGLEQMVLTVAEQQLESTGRVMDVLMALRGPVSRDGEQHRPGPPRPVLEAHRALLEGLTALFERYRDQLAVEPARAALALRALVLGSRQPWTDPADRLTADEIARLLLAGVRRCACSSTC